MRKRKSAHRRPCSRPLTPSHTLSRPLHRAELDLSHNELTTLPEHLELPALRSVALANNRLTTLPPVLFRWSSLTHVDVRSNHIAAVDSAAVATLPQLAALLLDGNPLDGSALTALRHLTPAPASSGSR